MIHLPEGAQHWSKQLDSGASVSGTDVDPLAVELVRHEIESFDEQAFDHAADRLFEFLEQRIGHLFQGLSAEWTPVHYFYLHEVTCPKCETCGPLYKDLVIAPALQEGRFGRQELGDSGVLP